MNASRLCSTCGAAIPALSPGGHCPACLLRLGLGLGKAPAPDALASPRERIRYLGDYELLEQIASGGMGMVFRARQLSLNRLVAVKMIRAGQCANETDVARFRREAEAAAQLDHPNIVPIYEVGEHHGQHYFSMKLIEGGSLAARLARAESPLPVRDAAKLVARIAHAVHYAHQRGILHRDLKPGNILLDTDGEPQVTDFGLAGRVEPDSLMTLSGAILGTPAYMAPEQAAGWKPLTTAVDIHSLGAVLYEMLTGQPPFRGASVVETLVQVRDAVPVPLRRCNPRVPRDLETICLKCLEKDPDHRYASADALAEDLERWLDHRPIRALPVTPLGRVAKWMQRKPALAAVVVALHLVAALGAAGVLWQWRSAVAAKTEAQQALREKEEQVWLASVNQARAERLTGLLGARRRALTALANAARVRAADPTLRNEAIAALSLTDLEPQVIQSNAPGTISAVAFDPVHPRTAVANARGDLILQDLTTGAELLRLPSQGSGVAGHAFSPDGRWLAAVLRDGRVVLWDPEKRTARWEHRFGIQSAPGDFGFHPVHPWLAVRSDTNRLLLLRLGDGQVQQAITLPWRPDLHRFSPDGQKLAFATEDRCAIWDLAQAALVREVTNRSAVSELAWHPAGRQLAIGGSDGEILWWHLETGRQEAWQGEPQFVATLDIDPSGKRLVTGHWNYISQLWDVATGTRLLTHRDSTAMRFVSGGSQVAVMLPDHRHGLWRVTQPPHLRTLVLPAEMPRLRDLAWSPDGRWIAVVHSNGLALAENRPTPLGPSAGHEPLARGTDGRAVADGSEPETGFAPVPPPEARWVSERHAPGCGDAVTFARDGRSILTCTAQPLDGEQRFWRWPLSFNGETNPPAIGPPERVLDPNPRPLEATTGLDGLAHLFPTDLKYHFLGVLRFLDVTAPEGLYELPGLTSSALSLSRTTNWIAQYHPQGLQIRRLAGESLIIPSAQPEGLVLLSPDNRRLLHFASGLVSGYATDTGQLAWRRPCATAATMFPTFSPDGKTLAVGGTSSAQVWLFDPVTGAELATLTPPVNSMIGGLAFSPDSQTLEVTHGRHITLWDLRALRRRLAGMGLDWSSR